jgi:hypothetical protein
VQIRGDAARAMSMNEKLAELLGGPSDPNSVGKSKLYISPAGLVGSTSVAFLGLSSAISGSCTGKDAIFFGFPRVVRLDLLVRAYRGSYIPFCRVTDLIILMSNNAS